VEATHKFTIFADYFQFIVMDETSDADFSAIWTEEALERMLAADESALCPGTLRNVNVEVELHLLKRAPSLDLNAYDHVSEASFVCSSGKVVVMSCTGYLPEAPRIDVRPGTYEALFAVSGVATISSEWEPAEDKYSLFLWPGAARQAKLLKHWKRAA